MGYSEHFVLLYPAYYAGVLTIHPALPGVFISTAAMAITSLFDRKRGAEE